MVSEENSMNIGLIGIIWAVSMIRPSERTSNNLG